MGRDKMDSSSSKFIGGQGRVTSEQNPPAKPSPRRGDGVGLNEGLLVHVGAGPPSRTGIWLLQPRPVSTLLAGAVGH